MYKGTTKNFNPMIAMASDIVIVEAEEFVNTGEINKEMIMTPGVVVDYIVKEAN
jgi:acetate CoA/acetoacetate CoA-transferase alpha subunit